MLIKDYVCSRRYSKYFNQLSRIWKHANCKYKQIETQVFLNMRWQCWHHEHATTVIFSNLCHIIRFCPLVFIFIPYNHKSSSSLLTFWYIFPILYSETNILTAFIILCHWPSLTFLPIWRIWSSSFMCTVRYKCYQWLVTNAILNAFRIQFCLQC